MEVKKTNTRFYSENKTKTKKSNNLSFGKISPFITDLFAKGLGSVSKKETCDVINLIKEISSHPLTVFFEEKKGFLLSKKINSGFNLLYFSNPCRFISEKRRFSSTLFINESFKDLLTEINTSLKEYDKIIPKKIQKKIDSLRQKKQELEKKLEETTKSFLQKNNGYIKKILNIKIKQAKVEEKIACFDEYIKLENKFFNSLSNKE